MIPFKRLTISVSLLATVLLTGAASGRLRHPVNHSAMDWTTEIGTFTLLPRPDESIIAGLWGISPSGDNIVGTTWQQIGRPYGWPYMVGYTPQDLSRVYRIGFPTSARGVNDAGDVAGIYRDTTVAGDPYHGFLLHEDTYYRIDVPGAISTAGNGINNAGTVVGTYLAPDRTQHQYEYKDGEFRTFDLPASLESCFAATFAINASGTVAGRFRRSRPHMACGGPWHAFVGNPDGAFIWFDATADAISTEAYGINDRGDIVGQYDTANGQTHAFVFRGNGDPTITIDFPHQIGTPYTIAHGIDGSGMIVIGSVGADNFTGTGPIAGTFKLTLCGALCGQTP